MKAPLTGELNPNHGVTKEIRDHWYKLCAILINKQGLTGIRITTADIDAFERSGRTAIVIHPEGDVIKLYLVTEAEALAIARKAGGLPV